MPGEQEAEEKDGNAKHLDRSVKGLLAIVKRKRDEENELFLHDEKSEKMEPW